jgi:hypothetical protein
MYMKSCMASIEHHSSRQQRALADEVRTVQAQEDQTAVEPDFGDLLGLPPVPVRERFPCGQPKRTKKLRKATLVSAQYLTAAYGHPIETMLQMAAIPIEELALRLKITLHEAWIERRLLLAMAAPYLVPRMPQGVAVVPMTGVDVDRFGVALGPIFAATSEPAPGENGIDGASHPGAAPGANGFDDPQLRQRIEREAGEVFFARQTIEATAETVVETDPAAHTEERKRAAWHDEGPLDQKDDPPPGDLFGSPSGRARIANTPAIEHRPGAAPEPAQRRVTTIAAPRSNEDDSQAAGGH